jgi:hypothetical protein
MNRIWKRQPQSEVRRKELMETYQQMKDRLRRNPWAKVKAKAPWIFGTYRTVTVRGAEWELKDATMFELAREAAAGLENIVGKLPLKVATALRGNLFVVIE